MNATVTFDVSVRVLGKSYNVTVTRNQTINGKSRLWKAYGDYEGNPVEAKGRTESEAVDGWASRAKSLGDN